MCGQSSAYNRRGSRLGEAYIVLQAIFFLRGFIKEAALIESFIDKSVSPEHKQKGITLIANHVRFDEMVDKCLSVIDKLLDKDVGINEQLNILILNAKP